MLPAAELDRILAAEPHVTLADRARRLEVRRPREIVSTPVRLVHDATTSRPDPRLEAFDTATWVGTDGREARVVWIDGQTQRRAGL